MSIGRKIVSLDLGTASVKVVVSEVVSISPPLVSVLGLGIASSKGLRKGMIVNMDLAAAAMSEAIELAEVSSSEKITSINLSISGVTIDSINSEASRQIKNNSL
jgi:cell division protein FtsA